MLKDNAYRIKSFSVDAVISCILGSLSLMAMLVSVILSYRYDGEGPAVVGLIGIAGLLFALCGVVFGKESWNSQEGGLLMKRIAIILNVISLGIAVILYIVGWVV